MEEYNFYCSHHHQDSTFKRKGAWSPEEDDLLRKCVEVYGEGRWHLVPARAGLNRCRKSCRLRWLNYLCPNIKRGELSMDEIDLVIRLHKLLGNRWSLIAGRLPGRTANQIKNHWNIHFRNRITDCHSSYKDTKKHSFVKVIRPKPRFIKCTIQFDVPRTPGIQPPNQKDKMEASECGPKEHTVQSEEGATTDKEEQDNIYFMNTTPDHEFAPTTTLESMGYEDECIWDAFLKNLEHLNE